MRSFKLFGGGCVAALKRIKREVGTVYSRKTKNGWGLTWKE